MAQPTPTIRTERLVLRAWGQDEAKRLLDIRCRDDVARWLGDPTPWTELSTAAEMVTAWAKQNDQGLGVWAIDAGQAAGPVGSVSLRHAPNSKEIEIGWYLHPDSGGNGYATEAAQALLNHAFMIGIDQVWALMWPSNEASARVAQAIDMTDLGDIEDAWYGTEEEPLSRVFVARRSDSRTHKVVAAVLVSDDRVLLCHRHPSRQWYPDVWDLPGGHIEPGETQLEALQRELREELAVELNPSSAIFLHSYSPHAGLYLAIWAVSDWVGTVTNAALEEHDNIGWFDLLQLQALDLADSNVVTPCRWALHQSG